MTEEKDPPAIDGVLASMNHENGTPIKIATLRTHLPREGLQRGLGREAVLALRGCAFWVRSPEGPIEQANTVIVGGGRCFSHRDLINDSYEIYKQHISVYENPNMEMGFYTFSGFFVPRSIAMWCAMHIEDGLKDGWSRRSAFSELQSDGVIWAGHEAEWKHYQKELAEDKP